MSDETTATATPAAPAPAAPSTPAAPSSDAGFVPRVGGTRPPPAAAPGAPVSAEHQPEAPEFDLEIPEEGEESGAPPAGGETPGQAPADGTPPEGEKPAAGAAIPDTAEVEIEFQGEQLRVPVGKLKEIVLGAEDKIAEANQAIEDSQKRTGELKAFVDEMREDFTNSAWRVLYDKHKGDETKAWDELVGRCKAIVDRDAAWKGMGQAEREAILARRDANRYKSEAEELRKAREAEDLSDRQAQELERFIAAGRPALEQAGLPITENNLQRLKDIYEFNVRAGKKPTVAACAQLVKRELERYRGELKVDAVASMDPLEVIKKYPDFAKGLIQAGLRLAKAKVVRSGAAGGAPANGAAAAPGKAAPARPAEDDEPIVMPMGLSTPEFFRQVREKTKAKNRRR